jgi:hypothetical protein
MAKRFGYRQSLQWIVYNDDIDWLFEEDISPSVTIALVADQFGKDITDAVKDLQRMAAKLLVRD